MSDLPPLPTRRLPAQKLCDTADFFDPRTDAIIRERFQLPPRLNARLWEFARAYDLLESIGALGPGSRGISFGSGREVLLYAAAKLCDHLTVTDLYEPDTDWGEARAADPHAFVMAGAPFPVDPSRLSVQSMDARTIGFPDASFDFAYSISAFEHFGDDPDFLAHLREVRRVLKADGAYVLTTEVALAAQTLAVRGNYAFAIDHLLRLFREAGLAPDGPIEMRLTEIGANEPRESAGVLHPGNAGIWEESMVLRELSGGISAPVCFVLRPVEGNPASPPVRDLDRSIAWAHETLAARYYHRYLDWARLNPFCFMPGGRSDMFELHSAAAQPPADGAMVFCTHYVAFGAATMEWRMTGATSLDTASDGELYVGLNEFCRQDGTVRALHGEVVKLRKGPGQVAQFRCQAPVREGYAYAMYGTKTTGSLMFSSVDVMVRRTAD